MRVQDTLSSGGWGEHVSSQIGEISRFYLGSTLG